MIPNDTQAAVCPPPAPAEEQPGDRPIDLVRQEFRAKNVPWYYSGPLHFLFTVTFCLGGIAACLALVRDVTWPELVVVPLTFLYANLAEYIGHKGPMHHRYRGLYLVFFGHTHIHHLFFPADSFAYEQTRDFHALLLPPYLIIFFLGGFAAPIGVILYFLFSANVALLFVATALGYFLNYELLHFCYHAPETSIWLHIPFMRALRHHHLMHHDPRLMTRYNFNITYPVFDWLFGTIYRGSRAAAPAAPARAASSEANPGSAH